jgi:hypothetical protein
MEGLMNILALKSSKMPGDQRSLTIRTMVARVQDEFEGFRALRDYELVQQLMTTAYDNGFKLQHMVQHAHKGVRGYGFFRDKSHIAGVGMIRTGFGSRFAVTASTTGEIAGFWSFMLDNDGSLLISRDSQPCTEVGELEGLELMTAVIVSALTESLEQPKPRRGLLRRR